MTASTPEPLTGAEVRALRAVAEGATPGPWEATVCHHEDEATDHRVVSSASEGQLMDVYESLRPTEDAAHIATFDPTTILRLLALAEDHARLVGVVAAVEALADRWTRDGLTHGRLLRAALDTTPTEEGA